MANLIHKYRPRGSCTELFANRDSQVLISGPAGTGKSRACLEKLHLMCLLNPGMRALIVRKTVVSLASTALITYREHVAVESLLAGDVIWYGGSTQEAAQYKYSNGSTIVIGGMDNATKIMSSEYDVVYVQEAIELKEDDWEALTTRLRNGKVSFQQLIADTNPSFPTHWLKVRCDKGQTTMLNATLEENPRLFDSNKEVTEYGMAYISKLDNLTGVRYHRLRRGLWVGAEGLIYEDYDPTVHLIDKMPDGWENWIRYWAVDFGFTHPFVLQCWAEDPDGRLYLYRELFMSQKLVEDHAKDILSIVLDADGLWKESKPSRIICDHDAEGRANFAKRVGISTTAALKKVSEGIQGVQSRLKIAEDGKPRIYFLESARVTQDPVLVDAKAATSTIEELSGYIWDGDKEKPVKEHDDGMDTMRYMVAYKDLTPKAGFRGVL